MRFWNKIFSTKSEMLAITAVLVLGAAFSIVTLRKQSVTADPHGHDDEHGQGNEHADENGPQSVKITDDGAAFGNIRVEKSTSRSIRQTVKLRGRIDVHGDRRVTISSRYRGTVRSVTKGLGENVKKGEVLAKVENISSRTLFEIKSGISGTIVDRRVVAGAFVTEQDAIFSVVDLGVVWAELQAFDADFDKLQRGQSVVVQDVESGFTETTTLSYVAPIVDEDTQTILLRCDLNNQHQKWRPGSFIEAAVAVNEKSVNASAKHEAIQDLGDHKVIFVKANDVFTARPVTIGISDDQYVEIAEGLQPGELYASQNSFIVKAELLKSTAEHNH